MSGVNGPAHQLALLADPDAEVQRLARAALRDLGQDAVAYLRSVRRSRSPHRRRALEALAELGGWAALDETDQAIVRRLIGVKIAEEELPEPMHLCGGWYALPTDDQDAVTAAFDLSPTMPVTLALGESVWNLDHHTWDKRYTHTTCTRMYVSPVLDGWTLVFGDTPEYAHAPGDARQAAVRARCADLSRQFGAAHWYAMSCGDGWTAWCLAANGDVQRCYDRFRSEDQIGAGHPAEAGYMLPHESPSDFPDDVELCLSMTVARQESVDPADLDWMMDVDGHGVVGLTDCGRRHDLPGGIFHI